MAEEVIRVPGEHRAEFIHSEETEEFIRIESDEEEDGWEVPDKERMTFLKQFLLRGGRAKSWTAAQGVRLGYNQAGVYLHESHHKRFYGIVRGNASIMLKKAVPEALPAFNFGMGMQGLDGGGSSTDNLLSKLVDKMPTISDDMRDQVLHNTFKSADINGNGTLSRPELGTLMRRVVGTISANQVEEMMDQADTDNNNAVNFDEFCHWIREKAPPQLSGKVKRSLKTEADIVRASFRAWDKNGDGLISKKEVHFVLTKNCPDLDPQQVETLMNIMDTDHDGKIDYDEFIDFIFYSALSLIHI